MIHRLGPSIKGVMTRRRHVPPRVKYALSFDGVDDYVDIAGTSGLYLPAYTICVSVNRASDTAHNPICSKSISNDNRNIYIGAILGQGRLRLEPTVGRILKRLDSPAASFVTGVNYRVAAFLDASARGISINGSVTSSSGLVVDDSGGNIMLGRLTGIFWHGTMHSVRIYNILLSSEQIQALDSDPGRDDIAPESLVGNWPMNEGEGNTIYDLSGNGNHGTIYGATWVERV